MRNSLGSDDGRGGLNTRVDFSRFRLPVERINSARYVFRNATEKINQTVFHGRQIKV